MHEKKTLHLESMYLGEPPLGRAHSIRLTLTEVPHEAALVGTMVLDPNLCSLDLWGDRGACTKMGYFPLDFRAVLMRTLDPRGLGRRHYSVQVSEDVGAELHLIEHARAELWYLVIAAKEGGTQVVPLFRSESFADHSTG